MAETINDDNQQAAASASRMSCYVACADKLPPDGEPVMTKIDDGKGIRNVQTLKRQSRLWFYADDSMYVY